LKGSDSGILFVKSEKIYEKPQLR